MLSPMGGDEEMIEEGRQLLVDSVVQFLFCPTHESVLWVSDGGALSGVNGR